MSVYEGRPRLPTFKVSLLRLRTARNGPLCILYGYYLMECYSLYSFCLRRFWVGISVSRQGV